ncbi:hypothetical protein [Pseudovibrio sp. SCP19]
MKEEDVLVGHGPFTRDGLDKELGYVEAAKALLGAFHECQIAA